VKKLGADGSVGKHQRVAVVIHVGIADAPALRIQQHGLFAGAQIEAIKNSLVGLTVAGVGFLGGVVTIIPDVGIPVAVVVRNASAKHDLGRILEWPG